MRFFCNYANYALRAELCDFASAHNSGSPVEGSGVHTRFVSQTKPKWRHNVFWFHKQHG